MPWHIKVTDSRVFLSENYSLTAQGEYTAHTKQSKKKKKKSFKNFCAATLS